MWLEKHSYAKVRTEYNEGTGVLQDVSEDIEGDLSDNVVSGDIYYVHVD